MNEYPPYLERLKETLGTESISIDFPLGQPTLTVSSEKVIEALEFLQQDPEAAFDHFMDLTAVDYIGRQPRFEVVIHLVSIPRRQRLRVKVKLDENALEMPTLTPLYPAADWFERECYDLYGVRFLGHPNLKRIMLYEGFEGHPLRKDYPIQGRQPRLDLRKPEVLRSDEALEPPKE
jgi:NADH-quinone oxidoreductase subunit C